MAVVEIDEVGGSVAEVGDVAEAGDGVGARVFTPSSSK